MKTVMIAVTAIFLASGATAYAQSTEQNTIHQSAGDRDSRGTPKGYQRPEGGMHHMRYHHHWSMHHHYRHMGMSTHNNLKHDPSIHQSAGDRDSRGTPKN